MMDLFADLWRPLLIGLFIAGIIQHFTPSNLVGHYLQHPFLSLVLMLVISAPMYICATGSIPIVAALMIQGLTPGAALVFLLAGPATNAVTVSVVARDLGRKTTLIYLGTIIALSLVVGGLVNTAWPDLSIPQAKLSSPMLHTSPIWHYACTLGLITLMLYHGVRHFQRVRKTPPDHATTLTNAANQR